MKVIIIGGPDRIDIGPLVLAVKKAGMPMLAFGEALRVATRTPAEHDFLYKMARFKPELIVEMKEPTKAPMWKGNDFKRGKR